MDIPPQEAGRQAVCPNCQGKFEIPVPSGIPASAPMQPAGKDPYVAQFVEKKLPAGICGILLGSLGIHKFILGLNNSGIIMLACSLAGGVLGGCLFFPIFLPMAMGVVGLIEGIIYLTKSDDEFYRDYAINKKEWF